MAADLEELIRTGQIDITTRETVEDERDRSARAAEPGAYALTYEEHIVILRANNVIETVFSQNDFAEVCNISDSLTFSQDIAEKIKEAFKQHGLDPDQLHALATRVLSGNWYILLISQHYALDNAVPPGFYLLANIDGELKRGILRAEDFPAIYDGSTHAAQIKALQFPDDTRFLYSSEYTILSALLQVCVGDNTGDQMSLFPEDEEQQRLKNEVLNALPRLQSLIPQKHLIPNNKLANSLTRDIIDVGTVELDVSGRKERELITRCVLNYEGDNVKLSSRQPFTEYDRNVADAVTSLYEYGDTSHIITAAQVFRAMVHATETETPSAQQIGAVTKSLDKMRFVRVQIDCSEELARRKIDLNGAQITGGKIDTYLLALEKLEVMAGGQRVTAYKIMKTPILYDYSRLTGQVLTVPAVLLDIRDGSGAKVANTERRIAIKGYLMRRISVMKGRSGAHHSKHILYEDAYKNVCEGNPSEKERRLIREYVDLVLQDWMRQRFIVGYELLTKGKKKIGVEIRLRGQSLGG